MIAPPEVRVIGAVKFHDVSISVYNDPYSEKGK